MQVPLPTDSLLSRYSPDADDALPHYTDCFNLSVGRSVSLAEFVRAFYTTYLFRAERLVLRLAGIRSADADIDAMLKGTQQSFAAWRVEDRGDAQLLMCDLNGRTRSWFMVSARGENGSDLYFGSAVIATDSDGPPTAYRLLLGLHRLYSRLLLAAAVRSLG
ncbi:MAG: hypothetical protein AAGF72_19865 [Pseudomonadota bacterium]